VIHAAMQGSGGQKFSDIRRALQAQAGYDSAKGAASDAASTAQDKASQYAEAGQQQVSVCACEADCRAVWLRYTANQSSSVYGP
jgi:hypothetical protein